MSNSLHIRNLDNEEISWLKKNIPPGVSQNDFLKNLVVHARKNHFEYPTFTGSSAPQIVYRKTPFKFIDLFAGIGGMRYGFEAIGSVFHQERPPQEKVNLSLGCSWARHWERKAAGRQFCSRR